MKHIIISYEHLLNNYLHSQDKERNTCLSRLPKDSKMHILCCADTEMSFDIYNSLAVYNGKVHFVECIDNEDILLQTGVMMGYLASNMAKKDELYYVQLKESNTAANTLCQRLTQKEKCYLVKELECLCLPKKRTKKTTKLASSKGSPTRLDDGITTKQILKEQKNHPQLKLSNTKNEEGHQIQSPFKEESAACALLLDRLNKIYPAYDFRPIIERLITALKESIDPITFEVQLQIRIGNEEAKKLHNILVPEYSDLKSIATMY